jgi:hypothetical protein
VTAVHDMLIEIFRTAYESMNWVRYAERQGGGGGGRKGGGLRGGGDVMIDSLS